MYDQLDTAEEQRRQHDAQIETEHRHLDAMAHHQCLRAERRLSRKLTRTEYESVYQLALSGPAPHPEPGYWAFVQAAKKSGWITCYQELLDLS